MDFISRTVDFGSSQPHEDVDNSEILTNKCLQFTKNSIFNPDNGQAQMYSYTK